MSASNDSIPPGKSREDLALFSPAGTGSDGKPARELLERNLAEYRGYLLGLVKLTFPRRHRRAFDPSDVVQEALLQAQRGIVGARAGCDAQMRAWLAKILVNTLRNFIRKENGQGIHDPDGSAALLGWISTDRSGDFLETIIANDLTPGTIAAGSELFERLRTALARLTPAELEVFLLRHGEGLRMREIAERLGKTLPSITGLLQRAMPKLRRALARE